MNLKKTTGLLILSVLTASCRQESLPSAPSSERTGRAVIEATLEDQISRIGIADESGVPFWQGDDAILRRSGGQFVRFDAEDAAAGRFSGPVGNYEALAVNPPEAAPRMDGGWLWLTLPGEYVHGAGKTHIPVIALSDNDRYAFYATSGLLKLSLTQVPAGARTLRFACSHKIQGEFMLGTPVPGESALQFTTPDSDREKEVIIRIPDSQVAPDMTFYIPVPVTNGNQKYENLSVSLFSADGTLLASRCSSEAYSVARCQMLRFKAFPASLPDKLYLLGGCFEPSWNFDEGLTLARGTDGKYRASDIRFTSADQGFKLYLDDQYSAEWFGADAGGNLINGPLRMRNQEGDTQITPPFEGAADITVDFSARTISMTAHSDVVYPEVLSLRGDATGGWGADTRVTLSHVGNGQYRASDVPMNFGNDGALGFKVFPWDADTWYPQYAQVGNSLESSSVVFGQACLVESGGGVEYQFYPGRHGYASGSYTVVFDIPTLRLSLTTGGEEPPVDPPAGGSLLEKMARLRQSGTMFGMQIPTEYGLSGGTKWWDDGSISHSDVERVAGSHPAVCGWDISEIELDHWTNIDGENFNTIRTHIQAAYGRGAVNTISWHCANPVTGNNSWDNTSAVWAIVPGGYLHDKFKGWLDKVADFLLSLKGPSGEQIPLIFRPWHEHTGNGFWWGKGSASQSDYVALWRFTVSYLKETRGIENLLIAYAPDAIHFIWDPSSNYRNIYLEYWPGDAYVDIVGLDAYDGSGRRFSEVVPTLCSTIAAIAAEKGKIAALTETGLENNDYESTWWTQKLYPAIHGKGLSYALVWRNGNLPPNGHYFGPWKGCVSESDFVTFAAYNDILLEKDLPSFYDD